VILLSLLLAYLLFLQVFFVAAFSFTGVPSSLGPSLISSNSMLSSSLWSFFLLCCPFFCLFYVVYLFLAKSANISTSSIFLRVGNFHDSHSLDIKNTYIDTTRGPYNWQQ
jgi:hypothetical protein